MRNHRPDKTHRLAGVLMVGAFALLAVTLPGCGGGGSDTPAAPAAAPPAQQPISSDQAALRRATQLNENALASRVQGERTFTGK